MLDVWDLIDKVSGHAERVLLYGPPGTGKTTAAVKAGNPSSVIKTTLHEDMPAPTLEGHYIPDGDVFKWHDGLAVRAWKNGARLVLDEINRASGDVLTLLYAVLDDPDIAALTLPTGEMVYPRNGFSVIATMNGHPSELPDALRDRFQVSVFVEQPHPNAVLSLSDDLHDAARGSIMATEEARRASIRAWKSFDGLRAKLGDEVAAQAVFGERCNEVIGALDLAN